MGAELKLDMMKFLMIVFSISLVRANTFGLKETNARFTLNISPQELSYRSEQLNQKIKFKACNQALIRKLNGQMLAGLPRMALKEGLDFTLDGKLLKLDPSLPFTKRILNMDLEMLSFFSTEKKLCR